MKAYGDLQLANILFTNGLHARYHADGISSIALHPGNVASNSTSAHPASGTSGVKREAPRAAAVAVGRPDRGSRTLRRR